MTTAASNDTQASADEWQLRCELAAAFRLAALFGWDDHVATHMSARLPDNTFLLNPFGLMFEEITASNLMRMDMDGNVIEIPEGLMLNPAGFAVHNAVLDGRSDANCAMHFHSKDGVAVSALKEGLLPLSQNALNICNDVAYHDYEGVVSAGDEKARLQADLGDKHLMILRNHGTLALGRSIATTFYRIYALEWACTAQVRTLSMGRPLELPSDELIRSMAQAMPPDWVNGFAEERFWPAMLRKAERECPGFDV
ncbi:MAG: class II aldolase/adducin family protein [Novosphingobium sp.]|nr:class II aldolase/adducin family protein [Novosphingobium sp.]